MKKQLNFLPAVLAALALLAGCAKARTLEKLAVISENVKTAFAPDRRDHVYEITFEQLKGSSTYVMKGSTTEPDVAPALTAAAASQGIELADSLTLLPDPALEGNIYGVTCLQQNWPPRRLWGCPCGYWTKKGAGPGLEPRKAILPGLLPQAFRKWIRRHTDNG